MNKNKVKYGLKNVHYAPATIEATGMVSYETPIPIIGSVSMSLSPQGDPVEFYADDMMFFGQDVNDGYQGDLTMALIPDEFRVNCLGYVENTQDGTIGENANGKQRYFALMYEFDGDATKTRHVLYWCRAARPTIASSTRTKTIEPQTESLSLTATQRPDNGDIKWNTRDSTAAVYDGWYKKVYEPGAPAPDPEP